MRYNQLNNIVGWAVFGIALIVYLLTVAPTASFWDCGEFIACSNELEVTHPPGAPLFLLLGRIFGMFAIGTENVAFMVNLVSVFASAFTALFTFWITTMLARKGLAKVDMEDQSKTFTIMAAGVVAGLSCTFADSIWFNAVEAEVYALSSFFTAIVVWLIFKWEARADQADHLRWILLIAYLMGLSIGVHLLNLLTIPALALVYYYRKFDFSWKGFLITMGISVGILGFIQYGIIQMTFSIAWAFEKLFTGTVTAGLKDQGGWGLPMGTGATVFGLLIFASLIALLFISHRRRMIALNTAVLSLVMVLIGFSSYTQIYVRSNVDPPIDMNNPENIQTFLSYMKREQYGDRPLLKGPLYNARVKYDRSGRPVVKSRTMKYTLLEDVDKYVEDTETPKYEYEKEVWFPRMYDPGRYNSGPFAYKNFVDRIGKANDPSDDKPTRAEDISFFWEYQLNHMYIRYFLWNFAGRESDIQEARWESGFEFWDETRYTDEKKRNKAKNHFYLIPLFLGFLGIIWQYLNNRQDAAVIGMLFFFTGIAIVLYLNQYPLQPRERDYSYAGSFQTFCIWIGLGVMFLAEVFRKIGKNATPWIAGGIGLLAPILMGSQGWDDHSRKGRWVDIEFAKNLLNSCAENAILFTGGDNDTFPLWYIQEVEGYRSDVRVVNLELLISDWYIDQMKQDKNESAALPISMERKDYAGEKGLIIRGYPSHNIPIPANISGLKASGVLSEQEASWAGDQMVWEFKSRGSQRNAYILRKDSVMIDVLRNIAANNWERPVYFANTMPPSSFIKLQDWFRMEGLAYRILPIKRSEKTPNDIYYGWIGQKQMKENLFEKFLFTELDNPNVNFDEHIRNVIIGNYRNAFFRLANSHRDQIDKAQKEQGAIQQALLTADENTTDSLQARIRDLTAIINQAKDEIGEIYQFSEEKIPHAVVHRNITLLITQAQLLTQVGQNELANQEMAFMVADALANLEEAKARAGRRSFKPAQGDVNLQGCLIAAQHFARTRQNEKLTELTNTMEGIYEEDLITPFLQQRGLQRK
ncbi:MAG: DUF2723 domain-containing protein [Bacteroidota bacterium]